MFTGLVQDIGRVEEIARGPEGARLRIATGLAQEIAPGDSVAVNGCCLTASEVEEGAFLVEAMNETLRVTSLGSLEEGSKANLELALRPSDRLGGHIVQGHVDGTGTVTAVLDDGFARRLRLSAAPELLRHCVQRGSIALDGVSLTIAALDGSELEVSLVPETLERTTLGELRPGSVVNVESDILGKYVERLLP